MIVAASPPPLRVAAVQAPHSLLRLAVANDDRRGAVYCDYDVALDGTDGRITIYASDTQIPLAGTITDQGRDVALVADGGRVVALTSYAFPSNMIGGPPRSSTNVFARYVIELPSGRAYREGIVTGAIIQIPPLARVDAPVLTPPCRRDIR